MKTQILINPPPADKRCMRCGKHISELKPFGGAGDPLVGDFKGALLVKTFRGVYDGPNPRQDIIDELEQLMEPKGQLTFEQAVQKLEEKYGISNGKNEVQDAINYDEAMNCIGASWECRDCIGKY